MPKPLAVLNIEGSKSDSDLIVRLLKKAGYKITFERVETAAQMRAALKKRAWDIVISECSLPQFDGYAALALLQEMGLDIPFIAVSGTIGEETAAGMMKAGAHDYLMKDNLTRLAPVIEHELEQAEMRRERKRAEGELHESERRFRNLVETTSDWIWEIDENAVYTYVSPRIRDLLGYEPVELIGKTPFDLMSPKESRRVADIFEPIRAAQKQFANLENENLHKDGHTVMLETSGVPILDIAGKFHGYHGIARDITERKRAEQQMQALIEVMPDGVLVVNAEGKIVIVNTQSEALFGYRREELLSQPIEMLIPERIRAIHPKHRDGYLAAPRMRSMGSRLELYARRQDGSEFPVDISLSAVETGQGRMAISVIRDITERKHAEAVLRENAERLKVALAPIDMAVFNQDIDLRYTWMYQPQLGYTTDQVIGKTDAELLPPEGARKVAEIKRWVLENRTGTRSEVEIALNDRKIYYDLVIEPLRDANGEVVGITGASLDITERKRAENALHKSEEHRRNIFENATVGIYHSTPEGRYLSVNPAMAHIYGYDSPEEMLASVTDIASQIHVDPASREEFKRLLAEHEQILEFINQNYHKDGSRIWTSTNAQVVKDEEGRILYYEGFMTDITERKRAEDALFASESSLQGILQSTADGILAVSVENKVLFTNEHFAEMWKIPQEVISSKDDTILLQYVLDQLTNPQEFLNKVQELYKSQRESFDILYFKDGRIFERFSKPIMNGENPAGRVWSFRDITERKKMEAALLQSEQAHRTLFENVPVGLYRTTADGRILDANPALVNLFGFQDRTSLMKVNAIDLYADPATDRAFVNEINESDSITNFETKFRRRDGTIFYAEDNIHVIRDERGDPLFYEGSLIDITERKQAEMELQKSEKRYQDLVRVSPVGIFRTDEHGSTTYVNQKWRELSGMSFDEALGNGWLNAVHPQDRENLSKGWEEASLHAQPSFTDYRILRPDGKIIWVMGQATPETNSENQVVGYIGTITDITERKQAEEVARESEVRYRSLFEDSPVSLWEEDFSAVKLRLDALRDEGIKDFRAYFASHPQMVLECISLVKIVDVNKATLKLFGAKVKADLFQNLTRFIDNDSAQVFQNELISIAQGKSHFEWEGVNQTLDGRQIVVRLSLSIMPGYEDTFSKVIISMVDITARMHAEKAVRESEKSLRESQMIAGLGSYMLDIPSEKWTSSDILNQIFGINESYTHSVENWTALIHPDWRQEISDYFANEVLGKHIRFDKEYKIVRKNDGAERWVHGLGKLEFNAQNQPVKMRGTVQDITERKQAEEALRRAEEKYRNIFENSLDGIFQSTPAGQFITVNPALARMWGYDSPEDLVASVTDIANQVYISPDVRTEHMRLLKEQGGNLSGFEYQARRKDGSVIWVSENVRSVQGADDALLYYEGTVEDISTRKQAEEALRESEAELNRAQAVAHTGSWNMNVTRNILTWSAETYRIFGVAPKTPLTYESFLACIHPDDLDFVDRSWQAALQGAPYDVEHRILVEQQVKWVRERAELEADADDNILRGIGTVQDITKRKQAEEVITQQAAEYEKMLSTITEGFWLVDEQGRLLDVNDAYCSMSGYSKEELLQFTIQDIDAAESLEETARHIQTIMEAGTDRFESKHRTKNGGVFDVEVSAAFWHERKRFFVFIQDITNRKQAEETLEQRARELQTLYETSMDVNRQASLEPLLSSIVERAASLLGTSSGGLYLMEPHGQSLKLVVGHNLPKEYIGTELRLGEGLSGQVAQSGKPINLEDYQTWPSRASVYKNTLFRRVLGVPLKVEDKVIGVINISDYARTGLFSEDQVRLVNLFADQAALAIDHARLYEQEHTRRRELDTLYDSAMTISSNLSLEVVLKTVAEQTTKAINTDGCALSFWDHEQDSVVTMADFRLVSPDGMDAPGKIYALKDYPATRRTLETREPLLLSRNNPQTDQAELDLMNKQGMSMVLLLPLVVRDQVIGLMELYEIENKERIFTADEIRLAHSLSVQTAIFIENARLYQSVQLELAERKRVEESLRESEQRYRALFEDMPVSIWEEDFSQVKRYLDSLKEQGVTDFRTYFEHNPEAFLECGTMFKVLDVNQATLKMYHADSKEDLYKNMDDGLSESEVKHIRDALIAISEGKTSHSWEGVDETVTGEPIEVSLSWTVAPGHEVDFSKVIVTTMDITARKRAEESLRASEEKYRLIIENAGEALYVVQNGLVVFANPMFEKIAELPASELIGKSIMEFVPAQEDRMAAMKSHQRLLRGKIANAHRELKVRLRSGAERWIDINEVRTTWEGELAALTFATDITERKQSEDALQKSEKRFRALIANAGDLIVVIDTEGIIQFASPSSKRILGYEPEEAIGINFTDWVHPHDLSEVLESLASRSKESGVALENIKVRGRHKNGSWRILDTIGTSLINEPAIQGIVLNIRDITERELTEEALRTSESQFRAIFEGAAIGIALVDASGHVVKNNSALQEMLGYDAQELRSMVFTEYTHPDDVTTNWNLWQELIAGKRDRYQIEKRLIHKSGRIIWVKLTSSSVVSGADGKILFGVGMVEDITERKLREREQEALASITQAINQGLDLDVLLQNLLDAALHAIPLAEKGAILLSDAEDTLRIRALSGYLDPRVRTASFPSTSGYSARAVRERQPLIIADARADMPTRYDDEIEEMGAIQSAIVAPLMVKGHAIGAISLDNASRKEAFGQGELTTLSTFASSAALVIQNTRLFEETRQRVTELELLYESGLAISQLLSPKEIGQKIIDLLGQKMNWHHTAIRLYNAEDETLELLAFHQPDIKSAEERLAVEARFKSMISRSSQGLSGWVIQHGETVRTGNLISDSRYAETFAGLHSGLYVPIKTGERTIGVISIESEKENAFSKSDEQLTTILAAQAASIFENARLYEDTIQRAAELEQRVTERTAQIEATKRRLELAAHAGQIGVWEYNPRENKVIWDERMHMIHQIPVGGFDGTSESWAKLIHPHDLEKSQINKQLAFTQNLLLNDEHRILWPDGSVRHILASAVMAYSPEGIPDRIIGINMDITERKQIEQSLRESEAYARLLFDAVPDPVSVTEADGLIVDVNKVFEKQYGLVRDEIRGRRISELGIYPETELDKRDNYLSEILQGQSADPVELEFNVPGDRVHTLEMHSYLIRVKGRRLVLNTSHDITAYKKAEETQRLAKSEMEHALRIKNEFLANMSHELRTPLNSILGISESLEEQIVGALNEKQLKYIGIVRESGRHLLELINDILDLSKIEAGRMELDIHHISVEKFCQSSLRMVKELAQKKSLNVSFKIKGEVKIILADERRLKQSLVNLLSNAVKFTPDGREIGLEVNGHPESNEVTFTVWDHGIGIAEENIKRLFKPFVQLDASLSREYQGTGLGLALVAQMIHLHGGHVRVESEVGQGSRFTITLPWSPNEQTPKAKVTAELSFSGLRSDEKRNGRILLVEDTDVVVQLVSEYLQYKGYEVILAHNGVEGVKLAAQERPDLILMDVMMPIMDGLEATQKIRKDKTLQSIPIIALTALAMSGDSERCLAAGMNDYLSKPIQMQELADMIEKYMRPGWEESNEQ